MTILNFRKKNNDKTKQLNEVNSYIETNLQQLYSYTAWACGNKDLADTVLHQALNKVEKDIHSNLKLKSVTGDFHKALQSECDIRKSLDIGKKASLSNIAPMNTEKNTFRVLMNKLPEKYSQPLTMQIIGRFSIPEISYALEISDAETAVRLSAARKLLAGYAALEQPKSVFSTKVEMAMIAATELQSLQPTLNSQAQISAR